MRNEKQIISLLVVLVACLAVLLLTGVLSMGVIALRNIIPASVTATVTPARPPAKNATPTDIQLPSPTAAQLPSPTQPEMTDTPLPGATVEPPTAGPVPAPTQFPDVFVPGAWCVPWNSPSKKAQVVKVIDGVTFSASIDSHIHQVRYIGLDLLETDANPELWAAMFEKNRSLVEGKTVLLIEGVQADTEDPWLRYVIADGIFVNLELVQSGYAIAKVDPQNRVCEAAFSRAQTDAVAAGRGLWAATPTPTHTLIPPTPTTSSHGEVVVMNVSKRGNGWQEPEEYVEIFNSDTASVQLEGWSVSDNESHIFWFPNFILGPGQYCRVYTDQYWSKHCGFTYHNPAPIWDNNGDCAYLRDVTGKLVDTFCYD